MLEQIVPLSMDQYQSIHGGGVEEFTLYCLGYWLQQNRDKSSEPHYIRMQSQYNEKLNPKYTFDEWSERALALGWSAPEVTDEVL